MALFGWCLPGASKEQHSECKTEFDYYELAVKCSCKCHEQERKEKE